MLYYIHAQNVHIWPMEEQEGWERVGTGKNDSDHLGKIQHFCLMSKLTHVFSAGAKNGTLVYNTQSSHNQVKFFLCL